MFNYLYTMHQLEQPSTPTNKLKLKSFKMEICKWNKYHINKLRPCWPCYHIWPFSMTCTTRNKCYSVGIFTTPTLEMRIPEPSICQQKPRTNTCLPEHKSFSHSISHQTVSAKISEIDGHGQKRPYRWSVAPHPSIPVLYLCDTIQLLRWYPSDT